MLRLVLGRVIGRRCVQRAGLKRGVASVRRAVACQAQRAAPSLTSRGGITGKVRRGPVQGFDVSLPLTASQHAGADREVCGHVALASGTGSALSLVLTIRTRQTIPPSQSCDFQMRPCFQKLTVSSTFHREDPLKSEAVLFGFCSGPCNLIPLCNSSCAEIPTLEISKEPNFMQKWTRAQDK